MDSPSPLLVNYWLWIVFILYWLIAAFFTHRTKSRERLFLRLQYSLPLIAAYLLIFNRHRYFLLGGVIYPTRWQNWIVYAGMSITVAGIAFCIWARIYLGKYWSGVVAIKQGHKVVQTGPYAFVRHPVYTGWLIAMFGSALVAGTIDGFLGVELTILAFVIKLPREEKLLSQELGDEYRQYMEKVPATLFPGIRTVGPLRTTLESDAFDRAVLQSDQFCAIGVLCVIGAFIVFSGLTLFSPIETLRMSITSMAWWSVLAIYEGILLAMTFHARWLQRPIRTWVWLVTALIESSLPTIAILGLTANKEIMGPYRALVSSNVLVYALFIILSTLRLNPWLCLVSGTSAASGYLFVLLLTLQRAPHSEYRYVMPDRTYVSMILLLFAAGIVAALVAYQVRHHVLAALAEAETKRKLDRIEYDLRMARSIQMGLLPKSPPVVAGYDIAGFSEPADQTGGDYYDWIDLPDGRVMFTIADATGHGIGPALLVAACRAYFRALADRDDPLERITCQVDGLLAADVSDGRFITAALALLDPAKNVLSLYSAGHAPLFLYCAAEDKVKMWDADQPPLGIRCSAPDSAARIIPLSPGDALILVTDGFFEYRNKSGELLGTERLMETICKHHSLPANQQIEQIHADVLTFSQGAQQADDTTAVIIRRLPT